MLKRTGRVSSTELQKMFLGVYKICEVVFHNEPSIWADEDLRQRLQVIFRGVGIEPTGMAAAYLKPVSRPLRSRPVVRGQRHTTGHNL